MKNLFLILIVAIITISCANAEPVPSDPFISGTELITLKVPHPVTGSPVNGDNSSNRFGYDFPESNIVKSKS